MTAVRAVLRRIRWEQRLYWRNPAAAGFSFAFPLVFLVVFIAIYGNETVRVDGGSVKFAQYYVPGIIAFGLVSACYTNLAITLVFRREEGLLKRVRGTPLSPRVYVAGMVGNVVIVSVILAALVAGLGLVAYGISVPARPLAFVTTVAAGAYCFSALGIAVSTVVPNEDAAPAVVNFLVFPLLFISGTFGPVSSSSSIGHLAAIFPLRHLNLAMIGVFNPFGSGTGLHAKDLGMLVLWGTAALVFALRRFRWEAHAT